MSTATVTHEKTAFSIELRWKDLFKVAGIACIVSELIILFGIVAYFIWPYMPGYTSTEQIFSFIQADPLGGLMALDFFLLIGNLGSILIFLALYISLKRVNESYALIALVLGLIAMILIVPARPIAEMFSLSHAFSSAVTETARSQALAAGDALHALFNGTGWLVNTVFGGISLLISSILMLKSKVFGKATAWVGLLTNVAVLFFFIPAGVGTLLLFLSLPGYMAWYVQLALKFFRLGRVAAGSTSTPE
jgi:hypothetical protein